MTLFTGLCNLFNLPFNDSQHKFAYKIKTHLAKYVGIHSEMKKCYTFEDLIGQNRYVLTKICFLCLCLPRNPIAEIHLQGCPMHDLVYNLLHMFQLM